MFYFCVLHLHVWHGEQKDIIAYKESIEYIEFSNGIDWNSDFITFQKP
jgi:hypothetical protein